MKSQRLVNNRALHDICRLQIDDTISVLSLCNIPPTLKCIYQRIRNKRKRVISHFNFLFFKLISISV